MSIQSTGYSPYKAQGLAVSKNEKTENKSQKLSDTAQKYLETLKSKYGNVNFVIQDYSSSDEASKHLAGVNGSGEYNCIITPDLLEQMAADENVAKKYEGILSGAENQFSAMKEQLGEDADKVAQYGISANEKGEVSYYAIMKKGFEHMNKAREQLAEKRAEKKQNDKNEKFGKDEKLQRVTLKSNTIEGLAEKIKAAISGKIDDKGKDGFSFFEKQTDDKDVWGKIGGKSDGFDSRNNQTSSEKSIKNYRYYGLKK